jgi:putative tryptophan/tyrosine transport system substrate-binding protein
VNGLVITVSLIILVLGVMITPLAALAQDPARMPTVGVLSAGPSMAAAATLGREALEQGLKELGWVPGQTIRIDYRYADGKQERLDELAQDLVHAGRDVIVARATPSIRAMKRATTMIPIVMSAAGHDPVQLGLVNSLGKPGANITGLTLLNQELPVKQLQLLKEVVPRLSRVAVLGSRAFPLPPKGRQDLDSAAQALGVQIHHVDVPGVADLDQAVTNVARAPASGLLVRSDPFVLEPNTERIIALALKHRLPAVYWLYTYAQAGGLMSYGADLYEIHRRSAYFVDRILKGARPADLPIEEPSKFALIVNLKTARALGLTLPPSILARATEVIQ